MIKKNAVELIGHLRSAGVSYEEMGVRIGKGYYTIYLWAKGKREPSISDHNELQRFLDEKVPS